ncbi:SRPBCC domain-containing protein [Ottowia sp.]|uniref:SRPBCC domain-containing protein n=1 Tax=Ottowia sp. TaxID=1898956 RepID=UPI0039E385F2
MNIATEDRTLRTSRTLPHSPAEIYRAFASPDLLAAWWGPEGFSNTFEIFEFTAGGRWKFVMHGPDGTDYANDNIFEALTPDAKVVIRHDCAPHFTLTIELTPVSGGTHLAWSQVFEDARTAQAVKQRAGPANEQNIDRLARVLSQAASAAPKEQ